MACGYGACFGCVVPTRRGYVRALRRRPRHRRGRAVIEFCGIPLAHRIVNGSGTFDAIAARRAFGDALLEHFPFAAFVSKTVTLEPRQGNPPPRLWELAGGMINSIGLPNKGLEGYLQRGPAAARRAAGAADRQRHGLHARGRRAPGRRLRRARRGRRDRAQRLVPERQDRADHGRRPARARRAARRRPPSFGETVDRQAHAQLRLAGRGRAPPPRPTAPTPSRSSTRCAGWRCTPTDRASFGLGAGRAACPDRPSARSPSARFARSAGGSSCRSWAWEASSRGAMRPTFVERAQISSRWALNRSAIRWPPAGSPTRCPASRKDSLQTAHAAVRVARPLAQNGSKALQSHPLTVNSPAYGFTST